MTVYCDVMDCKKNDRGKCKNRFQTGEEAIKLHENCFGVLICTDCEIEEE